MSDSVIEPETVLQEETVTSDLEPEAEPFVTSQPLDTEIVLIGPGV